MSFVRRLRGLRVRVTTEDDEDFEQLDDNPMLNIDLHLVRNSEGKWRVSAEGVVRGSVRTIRSDERLTVDLWKSEQSSSMVDASAFEREIKSTVDGLALQFARDLRKANGSAATVDTPDAPQSQYYAPTQEVIVWAEQQIQPILIQFNITVAPKVAKTPFYRGRPNFVFFVIPSTGHLIAVGPRGRVFSSLNNPTGSANITFLLQQIYPVLREEGAKRYVLTHMLLIRAVHSELTFSKPSNPVITKNSAGGIRARSAMPIASSSDPNEQRRAFAVDLQFNTMGKMERSDSRYNFVP